MITLAGLKMRSKKGEELSLRTIIMGILVVIILVVLVIIFRDVVARFLSSIDLFSKEPPNLGGLGE